MMDDVQLNNVQKDIIDAITKIEVDNFKALLPQLKGTINFVDENGMGPLQHACYKGNKEIVQALLDQGADVNFCKHNGSYTSLHFAALSGKSDIILLLLEAGINAAAQNSIGRTAAQMAAFVGNHASVATINNYFPKRDLEIYTKIQGQQTEPLLPPQILDSFHDFIIQINVHPVRLALNLQKSGNLIKNLKNVKNVLKLMSENEMDKKQGVNEIMGFKFHYFSWIVGEIIRSEEQFTSRKEKSSETNGKHDFVEVFSKRILKENKQGQLDYLEYTIRDCVREFPYRESTIFRQIITQLAEKDCPRVLNVLKSAINGQRGFIDDVGFCSTCGQEKPDKKCSKCKQVQYCDRECQRLHWFVHKKSCARPTSQSANISAVSNQKPNNEPKEISRRLKKMVVFKKS